MIDCQDFLLYKSNFLSAWSNRNYGHIGRLDAPLLDWEQSVKILDYHIQKQSRGTVNGLKPLKMFDNGGCVCTDCTSHPFIHPLQSAVAEFAAENVSSPHNVTSHTYMSLSGISGTHGVHSDPTLDVFIWQHIGSMQYRVDNRDIITLNPGDVLYITKGIVHEPIVTMPRVTVSTAIEYTNGV